MERKTLTVPVRAVDNHGNSYEVVVFTGGNKPGTYFNPETRKCDLVMPETEWVLRITSTPGSWYVSTLLVVREPYTPLAIDYGQGWYCTNFDAVFDSALKTIFAEAAKTV